MRIGQQALGHGHRQVRNAGIFHQRTNVSISLGVSGTFAQQDQRALGTFEQIKSTVDSIRCRDLARRRIDNLDQRPLTRFGIHGLREQLGGQIQIYATRTA